MRRPDTVELHGSVLYTPSVSPCPLNCWLPNRQHTANAQRGLRLLSANVMKCLRFKYKKRKSRSLGSDGGGMLNWFHSANRCSSAGLKTLGDTLSAGRPADLYLDLAVPEACHIPAGGIRLRSIQGDGPEALWVFWSYNMGLTQLSSSVSKQVFSKGNEKKNAEWMADGGLEEAL